ncbi:MULTISPECIES: TonB-dependent receptor [Pseudomonas]|uniref:Putative TonB-dependent exported protein n=1 Tax=Pseudomonas fluorescens (strain Pf0-1) TaxID=205922 RepID=Q3KJU6_PSEPF|nr:MULTISPECIES: TonB-dependent receptor [Pseudomonas]ABA71960.1 putative TonB-dependent exported protein [Pseudomonas fluorescens Pf0-1]MBL0795899.1 TonB-dependent receptor [Pseudomonas sp. B7]MBY9023444.1 TonB-dependent receptor [Pseudomonas fluorescens]MBY9029436.1 TonB-dependent receptor [Pseudomonas fluorescens]MBY9035556.1 TonB-dependent receptor [Pseudomonas fluorescens]
MSPLNLASPPPPRRLKRLPLALLLAGSASWTHGYAAETETPVPAPAGKTATATSQLETVTVTTRRREESSQDVPTPMSVVSGTTLETQRVYRIQDLQQLVPSVNVAYMHARQSSVSIRGLGNNPASDGLEGSVGLYIDNVYLGRPGMAVFDLMDIEQLEVLRGPQGTLFGKNTTAGVINISTRAPSFTPERSIETSVGEDGYFQTKGTISGPLNDVLAGRLSAYRTRSDGDIKNEFNGHDLNGGSRDGFRAQLLFKPNENFNLRWIGDYNEEDSSAGTRVLYNTGPTINGVNLYSARAAAAGATLVNGSHRKVNLDNDQHVTVHQGGTSVEANWTLPSDFTLTSVSSYRFWNFTPRNDDGLNVPATYNAGVSVEDKQYSQEFRLASPKGEFFDYVLGAYYFGSDLDNKSFAYYGPQADIWNGTPRGALANVNSVGRGHIKTDSFALFAQGTWHLTPRLDFTAGVRGTYEEKNAWVNRDAPVGGAAVTGAAATARRGRTGAYDSGDLNQYSSSPSGLLNLSYRFTDDLLGYATLSHGEKSGGVNLVVGSAPTAGADSLLIGTERANNAELGFKSTLWDRRLQLNANVFWTQVNAYQTNAYDDVNRVQYLTNAGSVRSRGVEFESTVIPLRGLTLNFNGSYNDVSYLSYKDAPCPPEVSQAPGAPASCDLSGHQVVGASKWIGNANGKYEWNLDNGLQPYVTGSYAFRSKAVGTVEDSDYGQIPSYAVVNLSTGLRGDFNQGQWDVSLWLKNAFDKTYYTTLWTGGNGGYEGLLGTPRTLGVSGRYDF